MSSRESEDDGASCLAVGLFFFPTEQNGGHGHSYLYLVRDPTRANDVRYYEGCDIVCPHRWIPVPCVQGRELHEGSLVQAVSYECSSENVSQRRPQNAGGHEHKWRKIKSKIKSLVNLGRAKELVILMRTKNG